ncbi:MAG: sugar transferase [Candidatus Veblenbacteria bacterium]|nr:sugar transferase [Candidatus Veblenbacteria bacterium]MDZ4229594.1 sugar transferase [Candidatus Veblenbacteria bacterium]
MKRSQLFLSTLALPFDYLMLVAAGLLAYQLRFESFIRASLPVRFDLPLYEYLPTLLITALAWLVLFALVGLYSLRGQLKLSQEIGRVFVGCTAGLALIVVLFFFNPSLFSSRFIVLVGWGLALALVSVGRLSIRFCRALLYRRGIGVSRLLVVGDDATSRMLEQLFTQYPSYGFVAVRRVVPQGLDLDEHTQGVDEVLLGDPALPREVSLRVLDYCVAHHLGFKYAADMFEAQSHNVVSHTLAGVPIIEIKRTPLDGWGRVLKRLVDIIAALILLIVLSPLFVLLALVIMFDSGWPVVVALERVGESANRFRLFKLRSMVHGADKLKADLLAYNERADGPLFKMTHDPRITRWGGFLRRTSLDELPQLWNVLRGEMSLVGPRPHEPGEVANYQLHHRKLLNIKPGITGLAQVSGRSRLSFVEEAKLDTFYVENWSLWQDFVILIKTIVVVFQRRAAV